MSLRKRSRDRRREIVETLFHMVGEEGPDRITVRALAARVGVTEPALYRHFPGGKAEMWRALAAHVGERVQAGWDWVVSPGEGAVARIRWLIEAQLDMIATMPALSSIMLSRSLHWDSPPLRAGIAELVGRFHGRLEALLEEGQRRGEIRLDLDLNAAAWLLVSGIQGTAVRWSLSGRAFALRDEGRRVLDVALAGMILDSDNR